MSGEIPPSEEPIGSIEKQLADWVKGDNKLQLRLLALDNDQRRAHLALSGIIPPEEGGPGISIAPDDMMQATPEALRRAGMEIFDFDELPDVLGEDDPNDTP